MRSTLRPDAHPRAGLLTWEGLPEGARILAAELCLAVDRPDRVEVEYLPPEPRGPAAGGPPAPGGRLELSAGGRPLFTGRIARVGRRLGRRGATSFVVGWANYEEQRRARTPERYYRMTDAEIATRIASDLALRAIVDPTAEVHETILRRGDPLRFLRSRAVDCGFQLAVTDGRLYFASEVPSRPEPTARVGPREGILELSVEDRGASGRGGHLVLGRIAPWQPLRRLELAGLGPEADGRYRIVRTVVRFGAGGAASRLELLERGVDPTGWRDGRREVLG